MKQLKAKVVNIRIPAGDNNDTQPLHIELGKVVKCALFKEEAPDQPVNVKIEDMQGHELHPSVTYKEYEPTNGNHYDSRKDIHFDGNREIRVIAQAKSALRKDFVFQMMFYFEH